MNPENIKNYTESNEQPIIDPKFVGINALRDLEKYPDLEILGIIEWFGVQAENVIMAEVLVDDTQQTYRTSPFTTLMRRKVSGIDGGIVHLLFGGYIYGVDHVFKQEAEPTVAQLLTDQLNVQAFGGGRHLAKDKIACRLLGQNKWYFPTGPEDLYKQPKDLKPITGSHFKN